MNTASYLYRGVKRKDFFDELPYSLFGPDAMPLQQACASQKLSGENYAWSAEKFGFRPKKGDKNKLEQSGIMAQLIYYGKSKWIESTDRASAYQSISCSLANICV